MLFVVHCKTSEGKTYVVAILLFSLLRKLFLFAALIMIVATAVLAQHPSKSLTQQLIDDDEGVAEMIRNNGLTLVEVMNQLKAKSTDLNDDGVPESILSGFMCGQNCTYWIYRRVGPAWKKIPFNGLFQDLRVLPSRSHGYHDLFGTRYWTCCEASLITYQFDGSGYVETGCKTQKDGYTDRRGAYRRYRFPRITVGCQ